MNHEWKDDPARACSPTKITEDEAKWFFPERETPGPAQGALAKRKCKTECPLRIRQQCFLSGLREPFGIWGGMDTKERMNWAKANPQLVTRLKREFR